MKLSRQVDRSLLFARVTSALAVLVFFLDAAPGNARYFPDTTVGPDGRIDITLRGVAELFPTAVTPSIEGLGFVTAALAGGDLALCAYTANAQFDANFGNGGCFRAALAPKYQIRQLLTGNSGYWLLLTDGSNTRHFLLLRFNTQGRPDDGFGDAGQREYLLACDASDTAPNCPELMGQVSSTLVNITAFPILAETKNGKLWLLAQRRGVAGSYEGVVLRIEQGTLGSSRANLFDALPAAWLSEPPHQIIMSPNGMVAHGDGVLVQHRTQHGDVLLRVNDSIVIDRAFAASRPGGLIVAGDDGSSPGKFHLPVVAGDDTFVWGNLDQSAAGDRYDADGRLLGPASIAGRVLGAPTSFKGAATLLWVCDGTRVGRWLNGQWDAGSFAGHGPYSIPSSGLGSITLASGGATLALGLPSWSAWRGSLSMLATAAPPSLVQAPLANQPDSPGVVDFSRSAANDVVLRSAKQADGTVKWQRIEFDLGAPQPRIAVGTVPALQVPHLGQVLASNASVSGQRWIVRRAGPSEFEPTELYADAVLGGHPTRRLNLASIRARVTRSIPTFHRSDIYALDLIATPDGGASLLVGFPVQPSAHGYDWHLAQLYWDAGSASGADYQPQVQWEVDLGESFPSLVGFLRDTLGGVTVVESSSRVRKISPQGVWDANFGSTGTLDLTTLGFYANQYFPNLRVGITGNGGLWFLQTQDRMARAGTQYFDATLVARLNNQGGLLSRFLKFWPLNPLANNVLFSQMLSASDGGMFMVSALYNKSSGISLSGDYRVLRFTAAGELDTTFGLGGGEKFYIGTLTVPPSGFPDHFYALGNGNLATITGMNTLTVLRFDPSVPGPSGATAPVLEYYNNILDHYFLTAGEEEIRYVETGGAGPGWSRTGQSFLTFASMLDAPGDAVDVCRFYGSPNPASNSPNGRVGPNSHFYSLLGMECRGLQDWGWIYEGTRLALFPVLPGEACPAGQTPVFRAYNNGFEVRNGVWIKNDSNHRYSTSPEIMAEMATKGWVVEGPRFCAPN